MIAGQGTAAVELIEEVGTLEAIIARSGGGGLMGGTAVAACHLLTGIRILGA